MTLMNVDLIKRVYRIIDSGKDTLGEICRKLEEENFKPRSVVAVKRAVKQLVEMNNVKKVNRRWTSV